MAKQRTAKQKAATRKLIAFNRKRRAPARSKRRAPPRRRTHSIGRPAPRRRKPQRRRSPASTSATQRRRNPTARKRRSYARTATISNPLRRRRRVTRRSNPITFAKALPDIIVPSLVGAGGAVGMDIAWGYLAAMPAVPAVLKTGWGRTAAKAISSIAIAAVMGQVKMLKDFAQPFAIGAVTVLAYETLRGFMAQQAPNVAMDGMGLYVDGLGYYSAGPNAGNADHAPQAMSAYTNGRRTPVPQLGLYTNGRNSQTRSASHAPASDSLGDWGGSEYNEGGYQY